MPRIYDVQRNTIAHFQRGKIQRIARCLSFARDTPIVAFIIHGLRFSFKTLAIPGQCQTQPAHSADMVNAKASIAKAVG